MIHAVKNPKFQLFSKIGFWISFTTNIVFLVLVSLSHYYAIKAGYDWKKWELSELVIDDVTAKYLFNSGTIINGFGLLLVLIPMSLYFRTKQQRNIMLTLSIISSLTLVGIGSFSEDVFLITHYVISITFFLAIGLLIIYSSIILLKHYEMPKFYPFFGFVTFFSLIFHVVTRWFFGASYTQRICILLSMIYLLIISYQIIFKNNWKVENDINSK